MKFYIFLSYIFHFLLLTSCCKEDDCKPLPDPCELSPCNDTVTKMGKLDTLWTRFIFEDKFNGGIKENLEFLNNTLYLTLASNTNGAIVAYDTELKGKQKWKFTGGDRNYYSTLIYPSGNLIVNKTWDTRLSLMLSDGSLNQLIKSTEKSGPEGILIGDYLYYDETEDNGETVHLRRSPVRQLELVETIYTLDKDQINNSKKSINSMNLWLDPQSGDSILIFQHRMLNRVDVMAWNMSKREVKWRHDDITNLGNSNHQQILIYENKAYFGGGTTFYCFEISNGDILWKYDHPSGINSFMLYSPVVAVNEKLIVVKDAGGEFRGFDLITGAIKMFSTGSGSSTASSGSPTYHKGVIYFTERGLLYAIRATNGSLLWSERSSRHPMGSTSFQGELAIDGERGILYATDEDELFAIRVIE